MSTFVPIAGPQSGNSTGIRPPTQAPMQAVPAQMPQINAGVATLHRAAEAAPAVKRHKKRKLPERYAFQKVARSIPESQLFSTLLKYEQKLDQIIQTKKAHLQDSIGQPTYATKILRLYIYNTHANQPPPGHPRDPQHPPAPNQDPPQWCLILYGRVLDPSNLQPTPQPPTIPHLPLPPTKQPAFTSIIKNVKVTLSSPGNPSETIEWDKSRHAGEHKDALEFRRAGSQEVEVKVRLEVDWTPQRYTLPQQLADLLGMTYNTRVGVLQGLWNYIKEQGLQSRTDPGKIELDDNLFAVFKTRQLPAASVTERLLPILTPMPAVDMTYKVKLSEESPTTPDCYDIEFEVPAPGTQQTVYQPFMDRMSKDREIEQVDQRLAAAEAKVSEHRRRRAFFLGFSQAPVEFINSLIASQARDLRVAKSAQSREFEAERPSAVFRERWVEDAVTRYLNRKMSGGR